MRRKINKGSQDDMFGLFDPRIGTMRRVRDARRLAGFVEVAVWIPEERKDDLKNYAKKLRSASGRTMPRSKD